MTTERDRERTRAWHEANPERVLEYKRAYRVRNPDKMREYRAQYHRKKTEALASRPAPDLCEICSGEESSRRRRMHFDHCHTTGKFRGWLCARCNLTLGRVEDNPELLDKLAAYLRAARGDSHAC